MIYKYTKCESVIAKIMADADLDGTHLKVTDIREWIFEAVSKIGAPMQYIHKESGVDGCPILKLEDYQVPMPSDLESLDTVAFSTNAKGPWVPARTSDSSFRSKQSDAESMSESGIGDRPIPYKQFTSQSLLYTINGMKYVEKLLQNGDKEDVQCFIKPGWIVLNRKKGFVKIAYKSVATDERGYPLIPDLASYQEAVYWYVMMKLSFPKYLKGNLGGRGVNTALNAYFYIQQQWNFYRNQAYAEAMMPTESDMRSIKNEWNKLIPDYNSDTMFFESEGKEQLNFNDYYYGY